MSTTNSTIIAPNGCPVENLPEDPTRLFSSKGITLDLPRIGWIASGCCTVIATAISFILIYRHCQYYTKPNQQRYIVRMLLMVPIYAITSWFSFVYVRESVYYDTIRVLYEAFVIASFLILLLQYLGDSLEDQKRMLKRHKKTERWFFPLCCLKYNPSRPHFLQYMKWGILQYVPLNILATVLTIVLQAYGDYCEDSWNPKFGHVWILILNTTSVTIATYFLIMFYFTIREDLKDYSPFYKFLAVKLVIFFSFWQSILIEGLVYFGYIKATTYWSTDDISTGINAVLIDVEMVFFALMHLKAFSYKPYVPLVPNPDLSSQQQQALLSDNDAINNNSNNDGGNNRSNNNNNQSLASIRSDRPNGGGGSSGPQPRTNSSSTTQQRQQQQQLNTKKKLPPGADPKPQSDPRDSKNKDDKDSNKEEGPPEMIMDLTQKTPIWKGLLDSFNPLDTIRELFYGVQYLYRWSKGIPVDKDSRRLLDLERAFGRQRPEVPYVPSKDEENKNKKKKKKKDEANDLDSGDDEDEDDHGGDPDDDNEKCLDRGHDGRGRDGDTERLNGGWDMSRGYGPGNENATNNRYNRFSEDYGARPGGGQRRADAIYDMGCSTSDPRDTIHLAGGVGGAGVAAGRSTAAREPIRSLAANNNSNSSGNIRGPSTTTPRGTGRFGGPIGRQHPQKKDNAEYLEKEEASHTERATFPDIHLEPIERKVALSGLYADLPLSPVDVDDPPAELPSNSSNDIPLSMSHGRHHPYQGQQLYYSSDLDTNDPSFDWRLERDREREKLLREDIELQSAAERFEHRDVALERDATVPYPLPAPIIPLSTRPKVALGDPYQRERELERGGGPVAAATATPLDFDTAGTREDAARPKDSRIAGPRYGGEEEGGHERALSGETSTSAGQYFYHQREGSHSDPELARYGLAHEEEYYQDLVRQEPVANYPDQSQQALPEAVAISQSDALPPTDDADPIVAQYNLQYRQKLQEQQQGLQQQQSRQARQSSQQQQRATIRQTPPPQRRRNSLESLDTDSTGSIGIGFRVRAVGAYDRDHGYGYGYGYGYGQQAYGGSTRPKERRYQRAYRYPMQLPQPVPPAQFYRFPEDRDIYERQRREQQERQFERSPYGASMRAPSQVPQQRDRERDQGPYQPPALRQQQQQPYPEERQQQYSRPSFYDDLARYSPSGGVGQRLEPMRMASPYNSTGNSRAPMADPRYRAPQPSVTMDPRTRGMPVPMPVYPPQPQPIRRSTMDYNDHYRDVDDSKGGGQDANVLFPASRYAAPFVRDYELQQREGRRRTTKTPQIRGVQGQGRMRYEDDGPYEEAVVWTRAAVGGSGVPDRSSARERV